MGLTLAPDEAHTRFPSKFARAQCSDPHDDAEGIERFMAAQGELTAKSFRFVSLSKNWAQSISSAINNGNSHAWHGASGRKRFEFALLILEA